MERQVDVAIIGAGTAGLNAMAQVHRAGRSFVLVNGGPLGTTCARVGCMPSKALIQVADDFHRREIFEREGITGGDSLRAALPETMEHVRDLRDILVDRVLGGTTDQMEENFIDGYARFIEPGVLQAGEDVVHAGSVVVACGSRPAIPPEWADFGERILTSDTLFEQQDLPSAIAVVGLGAIGLELGQALARLGVTVAGFDMLDTVAGLNDPAVRQTAIELLQRSFPLQLDVRVELTEEGGRIRVTGAEHSVCVDKVLACTGRQSNLDWLAIDQAGIVLDEHGLPVFDPYTMRCGDSRVFIAGDVTGDKQVLHEATDEGRIAGYNAARADSTAFARKIPFAITFTDPNICAVGTPFCELDPTTTAVGEMRLGPVGRALVMGANRGIVHLYADKASGLLLGAALVAPRGENLAHLLAWCIGKGMTVLEMLRQPFYHPTMEEALQGALRDLLAKVETELELADAPPDIAPLASQ